jgi:hypothetical protein
MPAGVVYGRTAGTTEGGMQQITVRRWVEADPADLWARLDDPAALVAHEPRIALAEPPAPSGGLRAGGRAVFACRVGAGVTRLTLDVAAVGPLHLAGTLTARGGRWLLAVDVEPLGAGMSDLALRLTNATPARRPPSIARARALEAAGLLLETAADRLDGRVIDLDAGTRTAPEADSQPQAPATAAR